MFSKLRGRKGRLAGIVAAVPLALGLTVGAAQPADATSAPTKYVALGDSYTAGQGGGEILDSCFRTLGGYPYLVPGYEPVDNRACQGTTTAALLANQLPVRPDRSVALVTLTVGGHDLGFKDLVPVCAPDPTGPACTDLLTITPKEAGAVFRALVTTYWTVKAKFPYAKVVVLSYPRLFADGYEVPGFPKELVLAVNSASDVLHAIIVAAARVSPVTFVDVRDEFRDHEIGDPLGAWIHGLDAGPIDALHPTPVGYDQGYYQALVNAGIVRRP